MATNFGQLSKTMSAIIPSDNRPVTSPKMTADTVNRHYNDKIDSFLD